MSYDMVQALGKRCKKTCFDQLLVQGTRRKRGQIKQNEVARKDIMGSNTKKKKREKRKGMMEFGVIENIIENMAETGLS